MTFTIKYKPLFSVRILHQYFLNKGTLDFFSMTEAETKKQLAGYDVLTYLKITPSAESNLKLKNHRLVLKMENTGFKVWTQVSENQDSVPLISLINSLELTFLLTLVNHTFINFTQIDASKTGKLYLFSNFRPVSEAPSFPLIQKISNHSPVGNQYQLGDENAAAELKLLTNGEQQNLFGLIRLRMKGENASLDITDSQNRISVPAPEFQIVFENRQTVWRYLFEKDQPVKNKDDVKKENGSSRQLITKKAQPLTENGFVQIELGGTTLPNPDASVIKPGTASNTIYSEIYM